MNISVVFTDEHQFLTPELETLLHELLYTAAKLEEVHEGEVSVTLVNNEEIQALNKDYRDKDQPTDVLSFPLFEADEEILLTEGEPLLLGDIVISVPRAAEQAEEYCHSLEREIGFLLVHGFLHLIGYDHMDEESEKEMFSRQEQILQQHGLVR